MEDLMCGNGTYMKRSSRHIGSRGDELKEMTNALVPTYSTSQAYNVAIDVFILIFKLFLRCATFTKISLRRRVRSWSFLLHALCMAKTIVRILTSTNFQICAVCSISF